MVSANQNFEKSKTSTSQEESPKTTNTMDFNRLKKKLVLLKETITVEPLVICYVTARAVCDPALKSLELEKACKVNAHFNNTICSSISNGTFTKRNFTYQNDLVQLYITDMHSWQTIASSLLTILVILLLGSCSDRYKLRKPFLLFSILGQMFEISGCMLCITFMTEWSLEIQGFAQEIVLALFGGEKLFLTVIFAYIADVSTPKMRTIRVAVVQAVYNICYGTGQAFTGVLLPMDGYQFILSTGLVLCGIAILYAIFFVEEPKKLPQQAKRRTILLDSFNPQHIVESFKLFRRYTGALRINIICILFVLWTFTTVNEGERNVMFLFTETAYEWTIADYSFFMTITTVANTIGLTFIVPLFTKVLQLSDLIIVALAALNKILTNTIFLTVTNTVGLYIGCSLGVLKTLSLVGIRSQLTKYVSESDTCKILSLYTVVDSLSEGLASDIYNKGVYGLTRTTYPQAFFFLGIAISVLAIAVLTVMYYKAKRDALTEDVKKTDKKSELDMALELEITHL